ncbi:MAG: HNH endonuclease [Pseudoruegeria sp.]
MAIRKLCAAAGCDELAVIGLSHCEEHEALRLDKLRQRRSAAQLTPEALAARVLYASVAWRRGRKAYLRANPLCVDCAELGVLQQATEVDHIRPHKGDRALFWNKSNWQSNCKSCHSRKTAGEVWHDRAIGGGGQKIHAPND